MDFSPPALQALGFALDLARQADGRVTLLHAVEWLAEEEPRETALFDVPEYRRYVATDAAARLRQLVADESRAWAGIDEVVVFGRAHREILRLAETTRADLVVMGAQGRGGAGLTLFGSATQQVVRGAQCPVLTVRGPAADLTAR
jgi:nucleotide-binding universal stress UspA family protein